MGSTDFPIISVPWWIRFIELHLILWKGKQSFVQIYQVITVIDIGDVLEVSSLNTSPLLQDTLLRNFLNFLSWTFFQAIFMEELFRYVVLFPISVSIFLSMFCFPTSLFQRLHFTSSDIWMPFCSIYTSTIFTIAPSEI